MRKLLLVLAVSCGSESYQPPYQPPPLYVPPAVPDAGPVSLKEGDSCMPVDGATCSSPTVALYCEANSVLRAFPCPGIAGCIGDGSRTFCDVRGSVPDAGCPHFFIEKGFCASGTELRRCDARQRWVSIACPTAGCVEDGGTINCR